jgi:hypothetical protein
MNISKIKVSMWEQVMTISCELHMLACCQGTGSGRQSLTVWDRMRLAATSRLGKAARTRRTPQVFAMPAVARNAGIVLYQRFPGNQNKTCFVEICGPGLLRQARSGELAEIDHENARVFRNFRDFPIKFFGDLKMHHGAQRKDDRRQIKWRRRWNNS